MRSCYSGTGVHAAIGVRHLGIAILLLLGVVAGASAQDIPIGATFVCNGERLFADSCNIRDLSDTSTCMIGHPDHVLPNGLMRYTYATRGELKQLLPTCQQPSAKQLGAAAAFQRRQQEAYERNVQRANEQLSATTQAQAAPRTARGVAPPKNAEERALRRCVSSGRLPASCTGNSLLGAFGQMLSAVLPGAERQAAAGPTMAGVFEGFGPWRLDFIDGGVLVNCAFLAPNQESYSVEFKNGRVLIVIATTPKPLVLTLRDDGTIVGPGPVTINGVVASGTSGGGATPGHYESRSVTASQVVTPLDARTHAGDPNLVNEGGSSSLRSTTTQSTFVPGTSTPAYSTFARRQATCPALRLSSRGTGVGVQTMQTDLLKTMLGGAKGVPTPSGLRMHGIYAAASGFSVQFFPESAILGCGPDAARAYPYRVESAGARAVVKINASDQPLTLAFRPDGSLDPDDSRAYQVHGRVVTGQRDNGDFAFAPLEATCNLALLAPSKTIPSGGGFAASLGPATIATRSEMTPSSTAATPGGATLAVVSALAPQGGSASPLAGHPYTLLRRGYPEILASAGISVPAGMSAYKFVGNTCGARSADCQRMIDAIKGDAVAAIRADANGNGTFAGVAPGTYHLMIATRYNNQSLVWDQSVQLQAGSNSITIDARNATPLN
ncbi:MAG: hypothetical protein ABI330_07385 [Caldimonas sp.]